VVFACVPAYESGVPFGKLHFIVIAKSSLVLITAVLGLNVQVTVSPNSAEVFGALEDPAKQVPNWPAGTTTSDDEDSTTTGATDDELCWPMGPLEEKLLKKSLEDDEDTG
jgi:hypothetical protein